MVGTTLTTTSSSTGNSDAAVGSHGELAAESATVPPSISTSGGKGGLFFDEEFQKQASSLKELEELCFTDKPEECFAAGSSLSVAEVSCASSTCSFNGNLSDGGSNNGGGSKGILSVEQRGLSEQISKRTVSRHGRSSQRWAADPHSHSAIRLTTGCIPIVKGGKVLFVSASSKPAWIFPKGGWENDEKMEESALRECFEEAGVVGFLGPKLSDVQYETRKARKRRLENEEFLKRKRETAEKDEGGNKMARISGQGKEITNDSVVTAPTSTTDASVVVAEAIDVKNSDTSALDSAPVSDAAFARIRKEMRQKTKKHPDETSSIQSDASTYSQVRMCLFPLYVTSVKSEWPECGRLRRAVSIDEAIQILETRPELQAALKELKAKGLHLLDSDPSKPSAGKIMPAVSNVI